MGNYGIKIAKPGSSISSTSLKDYIFHSTYPILKIKSIYKGYGYVNPYYSETQVVSISHGLSYAPMFNCLVGISSSSTPPTNWYPLAFYVNYPLLGLLQYTRAYTTSSNFYLYYYGSGSTYVHYKVIIYYDPVNP
jgi:hypothetical protein